MPVTHKQLTAAEIQLCENWVKYYATPKEHYVDNVENGVIIHDFMNEVLGGVYTFDGLTSALQANRGRLIGIGVATSEAQRQEIAKREQDRKAAEELKKRSDHDLTVAAAYIKNHCPTGLLVGGVDLFPTTSDKVIAFIRAKYKEAPLTFDQLSDAIRTLGPSLDWFSRDPSDVQFRNIVQKPRVLSKQARIDAGMEIETDKRNHARDGQFVNPAEKLRAVVGKLVGKEGPDEIECSKLSVTNRYGRVDHGFSAELKKIFAHNPDKSVNWKETRRLRTAACDEYEKRRNRDNGQRG